MMSGIVYIQLWPDLVVTANAVSLPCRGKFVRLGLASHQLCEFIKPRFGPAWCEDDDLPTWRIGYASERMGRPGRHEDECSRPDAPLDITGTEHELAFKDKENLVGGAVAVESWTSIARLA
jgi:hypothetical protein